MWGYSWEAGQSKQVVFRTSNKHIHELSVIKGGTWEHADLTAITGAPPVKFLGNGYSWEAKSKQVVFQTVTGHIHELYMIKGGKWQRADLTDITGAPPAKYIVNGYSWEAGQSKQVVYGTQNGHIHELYVVKGGTWQQADLTAITGAPPAKYIVNGYSWEAGQSKQVVYGTQNGHIHELSVVKGGAWQHADLTTMAGVPVAWTIGKGYSWKAGQSKQVVYGTQNGHIHELSMVKGGTWQHADLTAMVGAPTNGTILNGYGWEAGQSKQVAYDLSDGHIHELHMIKGGAWQDADLTAMAGAPISGTLIGNCYSWEAGQSKQVVYKTVDGHIHELYVVKGWNWNHADLTAITEAPPAND